MAGLHLSDFDLHLLREGRHWKLYNKLGAHPRTIKGQQGTVFALWAPNAKQVSVVGDFNHWDVTANLMTNVEESGYWEVFVPGVEPGALYKFNIQSAATYYEVQKSDPLAFAAELRPNTASIVHDRTTYQWGDSNWMDSRSQKNAMDSPVSVYEVHLASWMRIPEEDNRWLSYRELASKLGDYVKDMGFTHVELLPVSEHPFDGSWGYQTTGYFAPTSRFGTPDDFKYFVDELHKRGIGVIIDWVPAHFPKDLHGLDFFDGTHLYEHDDERLREHKDWGTNIFNYGRWEVSNFLISNALFWLEEYHIDGLRVDAVASMLYLDYSREEGQWLPNKFGGRENIEAIEFLRKLNEMVYSEFPDVMTFAEESTSFGGVSKPTYTGGLGFGYKWDMGWMHDTLEYFSKDPVYRKYHQNDLTFRGLYMFAENFILPFSHDEVVHGKGSLLRRMPGDLWQMFANLRAVLAYMYAQPGKKLLFMGCEFGQFDEWNSGGSIDWHLLQHGSHQGVKALTQALNHLYRTEPALHQKDCDASTFYMVDCSDTDNSVMSFIRRGYNADNGQSEEIVVAMNLTPTTLYHYNVGVPQPGEYVELLNTDETRFDGSNQVNEGSVYSESKWWQGQPHAVCVTLPPLGVTFLKRKG